MTTLTHINTPVADKDLLELEKTPGAEPLLGEEERNYQITATDNYGCSIADNQHPTADKKYAADQNSGKYCSWCQVELTSTWNPHTLCIHGYVNTETYPRLE